MPTVSGVGWRICRNPPTPGMSMSPRAEHHVMVGVVAALLIAGYGLTLWIFYPGIMTYDAKFVYEDIAKGTLGDWQSPVMVWLWRVIDPITPGAGSMFLLTATAYWLGFALLSLALAARGRRGAVLLPIL